MMQCPVCDSHNVRLEHRGEHPGLGLPSIHLRNVPTWVCDDCGETATEMPRFKMLCKCVAETLADCRRVLSGREFAFLRTYLEITGTDLATRLGVSNVTVSRWEHDVVTIDKTSKRLLQTLVLNQLGRRALISKNIQQIEDPELPPAEIDVSNFNQRGTVAYQTQVSFGEPSESQKVSLHISSGSKTG